MNKQHQISTKPTQISLLTVTEQSQLKGGMAAMCEEKKAKAKVKV
jgi:hypothetical protein